MDSDLDQNELKFLRDFVQAAGGKYDCTKGYRYGSLITQLDGEMPKILSIPWPGTVNALPERVAKLESIATTPLNTDELKSRIVSLEASLTELRKEVDKRNPNWGQF